MLKCDYVKWTSKGEMGRGLAKVGEGEVKKMPEFCGHLLWMAVIVSIHGTKSLFPGSVNELRKDKARS